MPTNGRKPSSFFMSVVETGDAAAFFVRVTTREELAKALRERRAQVVIADKRLARPFQRLLWAQELRWWYFGTLIAALVAYSISQQYGVKFDWKVKRTPGLEFGITLTPTRPPAPPSSFSEE
jgi:hypothetical protein